MAENPLETLERMRDHADAVERLTQLRQHLNAAANLAAALAADVSKLGGSRESWSACERAHELISTALGHVREVSIPEVTRD
jgi:hypothetical protein